MGKQGTPPSDAGFFYPFAPSVLFLVLFSLFFTPRQQLRPPLPSWNQPWLCLHPHPGSAPPLPLWARALLKARVWVNEAQMLDF